MRPTPLCHALIVTLLALGPLLPAAAQERPDTEDPRILADGTALRRDDAARLAQMDSHVGHALREAFAGGNSRDIAALTGAFLGPALPPDAALELLSGSWNCRMIKAGGATSLVVYGNFTCRIDGDRFQKPTGSQRMAGSLHRDGDRLIYIGTGYVQGLKPPAYADLPEAPMADTDAARIWPDIAVVEVISPDRARLIFPAPLLESRMNLLELTR